MRIGNHGNEYAREVDMIDAPKTVWQAIAFSLAVRLIGDGDAGDSATVVRARRLIGAEWAALHANGIIPQRPPRQVQS